MANYIVSYDLNGSKPTHDQMDDHLEKSGWVTARILETVWYIGCDATRDEVFDYVKSVLSDNDGLIVVTAKTAKWRKLLVKGDSLATAWGENR